MNNNVKQMLSEEYKNLLKKHFNFKITDVSEISENEMLFFKKYINKEITKKNKTYDHALHRIAFVLSRTIFLYEIEKFLIGVFTTIDNKQYIITYRKNEYYFYFVGTTISNWIVNFQPQFKDEIIEDFMNDCNQLFSTNMEEYDPEDDEDDIGFRQ
jgi:hypothetical protein